jgi:hypothetical protein
VEGGKNKKEKEYAIAKRPKSPETLEDKDKEEEIEAKKKGEKEPKEMVVQTEDTKEVNLENEDEVTGRPKKPQKREDEETKKAADVVPEDDEAQGEDAVVKLEKEGKAVAKPEEKDDDNTIIVKGYVENKLTKMPLSKKILRFLM